MKNLFGSKTREGGVGEFNMQPRFVLIIRYRVFQVPFGIGLSNNILGLYQTVTT